MKRVEVATESELFETMTEVELCLEYQCIPQALELLNGIVDKYPEYLPAKEALRDLHRKRGNSDKADEIAREIALIREQLAQKRIENDSRPGIADQDERRKLTEKVDAIIKEVYETNDLSEIQAVAASRLVESLHADRCLIIRWENDRENARVYEYCRKGVTTSLNSQTAHLNSLIIKTMSASPEPVVIDEAMKDPTLLACRSILQGLEIQSLLAFPMLYKSKMIGLIVLHRCKGPIQWSEQSKTLFSTVAGHVAVAISNARQYSIVQTMAITDKLTGVYNRRFFEERMSAELSNAQQQRYPLCLAMLDIDHFKGINDTYGHAAGDMVLHKLGFLLKTNLRKGTVVARFGGEEFAVILPNTVLHTAHFIMENIRTLVESKVATEDGKPITISVGVYEADLGESAGPNVVQQALIQKADENLYRAKRSGRNRVCSLSDSSTEDQR